MKPNSTSANRKALLVAREYEYVADVFFDGKKIGRMKSMPIGGFHLKDQAAEKVSDSFQESLHAAQKAVAEVFGINPDDVQIQK